MDKTTLLGILAGMAALVIGYMLEGGSVTLLWGISAFIIVVGSTLAATIASYPWEDIKRVPQLLAEAFMERNKIDLHANIQKLVELSTIARREGLLALEEKLPELDHDPFFRKGIELVIDGVESELLREMLELELDNMERHNNQGVRIFETAGGFAPTMGIIGTVMGLVLILRDLSDPEHLGGAIATAFLATFYGLFTANIIYLPISNKLRNKNQRMVHYREMLIEGILSIQGGENPKNMEQKLLAFLTPDQKRTNEKTAAETNPAEQVSP
ncbi:MAG: hypothetical protein BAA01_14130 [Bacillus thermozeamaize]|mgnify:CR=1 FL=1|uniref:Uncharacterized protein n=1 Tax=Bacillus thermozeamaize TaxID=230954 RepID=A0A1Y3PUD2_9BACI|nr:MAG: hypothetical protein BAA01_14130 [Bacillus thermozeamaize]